MIESLHLQNFRCFKNHTLTFRPLSVLVGANNAGKSTIVEALRLLALVTARCRSLPYRSPPDWTEQPQIRRGVAPSTQGLELRGGSAVYQYKEPPAVVTARFTSGAVVELFINTSEDVFALIRDSDGVDVCSKGDARRCALPRIGILPQIGPLARSESILSRDHVRSSLDTTLASRHFRNQLNLLYAEHFDSFKEIAETTWDGLGISELQGCGDMPSEPIGLLVRDAEFVAEIGWMGHGLQMWLQIMWFLARAKDHDTVILDEPDVYMHADLQRKLVRLLRGRHDQMIVATHSVDIMSEVSAEDILIVDKRRRASNFATSLPVVQRVLDRLGSGHNINLTRLWNARKLFQVEGDDMDVLKAIQDLLYPQSNTPFDIVPSRQTGGWGGWQSAIGAAESPSNSAGDDIVPYCIFDRDYNTSEAVNRRYDDADTRGIELHVWQRKEIENYLLSATAIARLIAERVKGKTKGPTPEQVDKKMDELCEELKPVVMDGYGENILPAFRSEGFSGANKRVRALVAECWKTRDGRLAVVPGKLMLSKLSAWSAEAFGVSFGAKAIARTLTRTEVPRELVEVVRAMENGSKFSKSLRS